MMQHIRSTSIDEGKFVGKEQYLGVTIPGLLVLCGCLKESQAQADLVGLGGPTKNEAIGFFDPLLSLGYSSQFGAYCQQSCMFEDKRTVQQEQSLLWHRSLEALRTGRIGT